MNDLTHLMDALDFHFEDSEPLKLALTHPSCGSDNNQRLEFLGDAVLQLVISDRLYSENPQKHEGQLTQMRQKLVCEDALAEIARKIHLGDYLILDKGSEHMGLAGLSSVLSDAMEAVLAAVYLTGGYHEAARVIGRLWPHTAPETVDTKGALQAKLAAMGKEAPQYELLSQKGPEHLPLFTVAVRIDGKIAAQATEHSKKKAEQEAARIALEHLSRGEV